jgi:enoyl-CoA hydratase/carnithine racemase
VGENRKTEMYKKRAEIKYDCKVLEGIGILTIDNPPENWLEQPEFIPLDHLKELVEEGQIKGLLISGTGRHFSAGAKLDSLFKMSEEQGKLKKSITRGKDLLAYIEGLDIPVVAAIKGVCFGGGLEIALASHIRICSSNALFAFPETNHSLIPGLGGTWRSLQLSQFPGVLKMILGGDVINAEEAQQMKLIDHITVNDPGDEALNLLKKMTTDKPLKVIRSVMTALRNARTLSSKEALKEETNLFCELAVDEARRRKNA